MKGKLYYLDHAAATPVDVVVLESMLPYFTEKFYNPSSPYFLGIQVKRDYQEAKQKIAELIGAQKDEIVMTAGATESINIAFSAAGGVVAVGAVEHASVLSAAKKAGQVMMIPSTKKRANRGGRSPEIINRRGRVCQRWLGK